MGRGHGRRRSDSVPRARPAHGSDRVARPARRGGERPAVSGTLGAADGAQAQRPKSRTAPRRSRARITRTEFEAIVGQAFEGVGPDNRRWSETTRLLASRFTEGLVQHVLSKRGILWSEPEREWVYF
jgi:hypothetical protein